MQWRTGRRSVWGSEAKLENNEHLEENSINDEKV